MYKRLVTILFTIITTFIYGQNAKIKGVVVNAENKEALSPAHILNLNSVNGTITNKEGLFEITAQVTDTILVSYLGFESIKLKVTNDLLKGNEIEIALNEKPEKVKEVIINSTKLIGVLEVDVKMVPKERFTRIKLNGIKQTYELGNQQKTSSSSLISKIFNPVDAVYNLFGKKPRRLRKLRRLKKETDLRKMLAGKFDREIMMEYLEMDSKELSKLLSKCNYSEYFIKKASDLQTIEAILNCYENYKAVKKGKIEIDRLPKKQPLK